MSGWKDDDAVTITYRTLRQAQAEAAANEQERIIKLLETSAIAWSDDCALPVDWKHCQNCWQIASLITRIKGKNK